MPTLFDKTRQEGWDGYHNEEQRCPYDVNRDEGLWRAWVQGWWQAKENTVSDQEDPFRATGT